MKVLSKRLLNRGCQTRNSVKPKPRPKLSIKISRSRSRSHQTQHVRMPKPIPKPTTSECLEAEAGLKTSICAKSPASWSRSRRRCRLSTQPWSPYASIHDFLNFYGFEGKPALRRIEYCLSHQNWLVISRDSMGEGVELFGNWETRKKLSRLGPSKNRVKKELRSALCAPLVAIKAYANE